MLAFFLLADVRSTINAHSFSKIFETVVQQTIESISSGNKQEIVKPAPAKSGSDFSNSYDINKIANYYAAKYRHRTEYLIEIVRLVSLAAEEYNVSPFILLSIISHESNFQHMAANKSGAEGLMQIMRPIHARRFDAYGGIKATFIPEANIRVGAAIFRECIDIMRTVRGGLNCYAGTVNKDDGGFVDFVLKEATQVKKMAQRSGPG